MERRSPGLSVGVSVEILGRAGFSGVVVQCVKKLTMVNREAAATEAWQRTLSAIPTVIGRIAYLSSLRNVHTGTYEHVGLAQRIGEDGVDRVIRRSHTSVFQEWLCFGLERQKDELDEYLSGLGSDKAGVIASWLAVEPWNNWVPGESRDVERKLFNADLAVVLELVRAENGVDSRDPDL